MLEWFGRYLRRQRELAAGVDADLARSNRRKFGLASSLLALASLFLGIDRAVKPRGLIQEVFVWVILVLYLGGTLVVNWAWRERAFLVKPDAKKPPSLFK
jgi:hypothetical protein